MQTVGCMDGFMKVVALMQRERGSDRPGGSRLKRPTSADSSTSLATGGASSASGLSLSAIADPLFYFLAGPHIPPGTMSNTADGAQFDFNVLFVVALPVLLAVWIYMGYAIVNWRASRNGPEPVGGPQARSNLPIQTAWIAFTTVLVLFLFGFGTYELVQPGGRRRRPGTEPGLDPGFADGAAHPGDRPAVEMDLPLPDLRWVRDHQPRRARRHRHRLPRHLA